MELLSLISKEELEYYVELNPDGFGITYFCPGKEFIKTEKRFGIDKFLLTLKKIEQLSHCDYYIHFRKATVGKICYENTHPFDVLGDEKLFLRHNGTLPGYKKEEDSFSDKSDTQFLSEEIKKILIDRKCVHS